MRFSPSQVKKTEKNIFIMRTIFHTFHRLVFSRNHLLTYQRRDSMDESLKKPNGNSFSGQLFRLFGILVLVVVILFLIKSVL